MKKIVITGAAGLVGMNLLTLLTQKPYSSKYSVVAIDKNHSNLELLRKLFPAVKAVEADLTKEGAWQKELKGAFSLIELQAQIAAPTLAPFLKNNVKSVETVVAACRKQKVRNLIHMSSSVVISVADDDYTNTKKKGEGVVRKAGVPYTMLRPPLMFGCFDAKHLGFITRMMKKTPIMPIPGSGRYMRQPLYVLDMCKILIRLLEMKRDNKTYNVIGRDRIDFIDILKAIRKERRIRAVFVPLPVPVFKLLVATYGFFTGLFSSKPAFVPDQLDALTAGDDFLVEDWWKTFKVQPTPFQKGLKETVSSKYDKYSFEMASPH